MSRSDRSLVVVSMLAGLAACAGDGSDIGPKLSALPNESCKVVVLDDLGRGVVEARATVGGATARTGRNGRGDFLDSPRGRLLVDVDGGNGAAVAGDALGRVRFAATITGPDLPAVVFLPDLRASGTALVDLGTQAGAVTVTAPNGGMLTVAAGASVGSDDATATTVALRVGDLQPQHVPGDLPAASSGALLTGRVFCVDPPGVTFTPAADLDLPDDLGVGAAAVAKLHRLDPLTGEWAVVQSGLAAAGGRLQAAAAVATGGTYVFGVDVASATVLGRVQQLDGTSLPGTMVTIDGTRVVTDVNGRFAVTDVPAALADGSPRSCVLELFAGGDWLPVRTGTTVPITAGATLDLGDMSFDTKAAGNVRVQQIRRGRADALRIARLSTTDDAVALATFGDQQGQSVFEDVPALWFGFQDAQPVDGQFVFYGQGIGFLERGRRWFDAYQFLDKRSWQVGSRRSRILITDATGGGPLRDAALVRGTFEGGAFVGRSNESGSFFVDRDVSGRATATLRSARDGRTIVHAFSIERPNGDHLELPLQRVLRTPTGAFDRHGLVTGTLTGADPARDHRLRTTRRLDLQEWWDDVVEGVPLASSLPIDVDPATTHAAFQAGVALPAGHLVATELTSPGGVVTLQRVGLLVDVLPTEGDVIARDLALDLPATQTFVAAGVLAGADPAIDVAQLQVDLAVQQVSGRVVDVVRGLQGNHAANGNDLAFTLPSLAAAAPDDLWLAMVRGDFASGGDTLQVRSLQLLPTTQPRVLPAFPAMTAPVAGATVAATGFAVDFTLPAGALYGRIELRSEQAGETLLWQVLVPSDLTQFAFVALPIDADMPLVAGRSYTLTVSAYFGTSVLATSDDPYRDLSTFVQAIGATELGVTQVTRRSITVTAN